ncbi:MAG TPA: HAMP domain-containing sensor histidine kinase, partial [Ktedonobacterales bacterium]|nr:HAMP domain-containing sensor histidine kinase [Ktedonobacterales bacterium]
AVTLLQPPWIGGATIWLLLVLAWLALLVVGYVAWWSTRTHRLEPPALWFITAALLFFAIGRTLWAVEDLFIFPHGVPFPNLPDLFLALQYPCFFLAILLLPRRRPATPRVILILDFLLWMGAAFALSWFFMLMPIVTASDLSPLAKVVALFAPVGDLFVLLGLTVTLLRPPYSHRLAPVLGLLIAAFACMIVGDTWFTLIVLRPPHLYQTGAAPDVFWLICYLLIPLAALIYLRITHRARAVRAGRAGQEIDQENLLWRDIKASLPHFLPIVAALLASAVITIGAIVRAAETGWRGEVWPIMLVFSLLLLVIVRQAIICLYDARLRRELAVAKTREEALSDLHRRKDEFFSVLSHEIRTPLTSVQGYVHLLARRFNAWWPPVVPAAADDAAAPADPAIPAVPAAPSAQEVAQGRAMLAACEQSLQRLTGLADDLVDDTRIRDGQLLLRRAPCDLCALVGATVEALRVLEPNRVIQVRTPADGAAITVDGDADRIAQVITNYLSNALKYSRADQPVVVAVETVETEEAETEETEETETEDQQQGGRACVARVAVRDAGPGLSAAEQTRVWERFPRLDAVKVQSGSGVSLGLGLAISKAIVERHGGAVGVESAPGQGCTFWFTVPLTTAITPTTLTPPATAFTERGQEAPCLKAEEECAPSTDKTAPLH